MVCSMTFLHSITSITHCFVELLNGESTQVTHIGSVHLSTHLTLEHVLRVPSFSLTCYMLASLLKDCHVAFYYCPNFVFFRTYLLEDDWIG